jgi:hypothetical protein
MIPWIKWVRGLAKKPKTLQVAAILGVDRHSAAARLMEVWEWCDDAIADPDQKWDGVVPLAPGHVVPLIEEVSATPGIAEAMKAVGWLRFEDDQTVFPDWGRNNGSSTKKRLTEAKKKARQRKNAHGPSRKCPDESGTNVPIENAAREGEGEGEAYQGLSPIGPRSPVDEGGAGGRGELLDVSDRDWSAVVARAAKVAMLVPPLSTADRRAWLRYAVLSTGPLSEAWLIDAAQAVAASPKSGKKQGHFVAALKSKAAEQGIGADVLMGMARRIEIPEDVWTRDVPALRVTRRTG